MGVPIGGRLQPSREAVEALLRSRKGTLKAVNSTKESGVKLKEPRLQGYVAKGLTRGHLVAGAVGAAAGGGGAYQFGHKKGHEAGHAEYHRKVRRDASAGLTSVIMPPKEFDTNQVVFAGNGRTKIRWGTAADKRRSDKVGKRAPMDHESSGFARYGDGSSKGKRLKDEFSKAEPVSKRVRNKDAESDRQRRLGMGVAAAGVGSALLLRRGVGGALKTTKNLRELGLQAHKMAWGTTPNEVKQLIHRTEPNGKFIRGKGVALTSRQAAETAGGAALGAGALGLDHYSRTQRNRRWE